MKLCRIEGKRKRELCAARRFALTIGSRMDAETYCRQLLEQSRHVNSNTPISEATANAFLATPRHRFVARYREWGTRHWHEVHEGNLAQHLAALYADRAVILAGDDDDDVPSTISQPSFVLRMLDLLQLKPGHNVFELGTGSGWNAALMGRLVGSHGHVHSVEIIPAMAQAAIDALRALGTTNVDVVVGDGGEGYAPGAPYDRAIFTAGTYDLPRPFHEQIKEGGLLLAVLKSEGGGDHLFLLRKTSECFTSLDALPCGFVQLRGRYRVSHLDPVPVEALPEWEDLRDREVSRTPFWWGGKGKEHAMWRTLGVRSFLGIAEPAFRGFKGLKSEAQPREEHYFGLWLREERSLVLAKDDLLIAYGTIAAKERLLQRVRQWVDLGMPTAASFALSIFPSDATVECGRDEWLVKQPESQFLWSCPRRV
jgi:protein-L-isoaspartate(D-aspartate) O-methyltransferase